jgi:hypothetical protein
MGELNGDDTAGKGGGVQTTKRTAHSTQRSSTAHSTHLVEVHSHALLAAPRLQQLSVLLHTPLVLEAFFFESQVEGDAVAVPLCLCDHAVAVEQQCVEVVQPHRQRERGQSVPFESGLHRECVGGQGAKQESEHGLHHSDP